MTGFRHFSTSQLPGYRFFDILMKSVVTNTMHFSFAVCDDEPFMTEALSDWLSDYMQTAQASFQIQTYSSGRALLDSSCDFDLIFLDIQMQHPDGLETAKLLRQRDNHSLLIFVTVLKECVFHAFEVEAFDYLLKPLERSRFQHTMDRAVKALQQRTAQCIVIQRGSSCDVIPLSQLVYCEVQGRRLYLHQADGTITAHYERLEAFARRTDTRFFRCHRSYLVNLDSVRGCTGGQVLLSQGSAVPVSRLREQDLMQALLQHLKGKGL